MRKWIKYALVICGIGFAIVFYVTNYDVNADNLEAKIEDYLDIENVEILSEESLEKDKVFHFKAHHLHGVVKIEEGLFQSRIANGYYTKDEVGMVRYTISRKDYHLTYVLADENQNIELVYKLDRQFIEHDHACVINVAYGFPYECYLTGTDEEVIKLNYQSQNQVRKSSGPKGFVEFNSFLIALVFFIISIPFSLKFKTFDKHVQMDGQRIKQWSRY